MVQSCKSSKRKLKFISIGSGTIIELLLIYFSDGRNRTHIPELCRTVGPHTASGWRCGCFTHKSGHFIARHRDIRETRESSHHSSPAADRHTKTIESTASRHQTVASVAYSTPFATIARSARLHSNAGELEWQTSAHLYCIFMTKSNSIDFTDAQATSNRVWGDPWKSCQSEARHWKGADPIFGQNQRNTVFILVGRQSNVST